MARRAILTAQEIKDFSSADNDTPNCNIVMIAQFEEFLLGNECFNPVFYDDLKTDLVDYSSIITYSNTASYVIGDKVKLNGTYFIAIAPTTGTPPPNNTKWEVGKKFKSDCFNNLFCDYLGYYLSEYIARRSTTTDKSSVMFEKFNAKGFDVYMKGSDALVSMTLQNTIAYMRRTECLKKYLPVLSGSCNDECGDKTETKNDCFVKSKMQFA
jgi:hypothetical protein